MLRLEPVRLFTGSAPQEACRLQLKKFKEALPNDLKEQKRALLDAIYLEIEENLPGEHAGGGQDSWGKIAVMLLHAESGGFTCGCVQNM